MPANEKKASQSMELFIEFHRPSWMMQSVSIRPSIPLQCLNAGLLVYLVPILFLMLTLLKKLVEY
jgi:positive regulator of sigma E activity